MGHKKVETPMEAGQPSRSRLSFLDTPRRASEASVARRRLSPGGILRQFDILKDKFTVRIVTCLSLTALFLGVAGCGGKDSNPRAGEAISKELFIEAYVQLRLVGLRSPSKALSLEARDRVLEKVGTTEEELLTFVEIWGNNGDVMVEVWGSIDSLMTQERMRDRGRPPVNDEDDPKVGSIDFRGTGER